MYLKSLEMIGFKSFADKTKLDFEPGMTAIVGPNGCGKSNVSDAIRWVIGEQSAKALRAGKMEDCIFNGTDARKPLAMAEVSITFADCEKSLGTEYHEVTISRRVFRSGEGQYFINKTPCRLKDIQRLFMDTGVGTVSYSLMEQGRIDRVLSSHPEDRREIFEEASGITKFKADKTEAIRKLEHTEANLLRLADVIKEVKRQIGSLQRQAGKARTYKALRDELRKLDLFTAKRHLSAMDSNIQQMTAKIQAYATTVSSAQAEVDEYEKGNTVLRESILHTEREVGSVLEAGAQTKNKLDHTRELIVLNRQRIDEYRQWSDRDTREISEIKRQISEKRATLDALLATIEEVRAKVSQSQKDLASSTEAYSSHQIQIDQARAQIHRLREESVEMESMAFRLQNQLVEIESRERATEIQKERLAAEKAQLARVLISYEKKKADMEEELAGMNRQAAASEQDVAATEQATVAKTAELTSVQKKRSDLQSRLAAMETQYDLLTREDQSGKDLPPGSKALLEKAEDLGINRAKLLGSLSSNIEVDPAYRLAVEAALRSWLDSIIVSDRTDALAAIKAIENHKAGSLRLLAPPSQEAPKIELKHGEEWLANRVTCQHRSGDAVKAALAGHILVDSLEKIPSMVPHGITYVTRHGLLIRGDGCMEIWASDSRASAPLSRKHLIDETRIEVETLERNIQETETAMLAAEAEIEKSNTQHREMLTRRDRDIRALAQKEGETQVISREAKEAREHLDTVSWELQNMESQGASRASEKDGVLRNMDNIKNQRQKVAADIKGQTDELQNMERRHSELQSELTERKIAHSSLQQKLENLESQHAGLAQRIDELDSTVKGHADNIHSHESSIERLTAEISAAEGTLASLEEAVASNASKADLLRKNREKQSSELAQMERVLSQKRTHLEEARAAKSSQEIQLAECRMRRQNNMDRVTSEYGITQDQVLNEPDPEWKDAPPPSLESAETSIAELRTKIEAMGPVNLVAIEEYNELEERHKFLTNQEQDLVNAKQQLMEMIRKINRTTSDMFKATFDQVNTNFQDMFARLFNGGSAKLVLVNEEDILDCGIEIIARPPGKRLQNISLLSGGERTMTAVALLFSIYMIKPSPFCLLDELDAALDESNIGRFVGVLKDFLRHSQFVVITHNRQTISAAHVLYGVTMPEKGISRIVSLKFADYKDDDSVKAVAAAKAKETPAPEPSAPEPDVQPPAPAPEQAQVELPSGGAQSEPAAEAAQPEPVAVEPPPPVVTPPQPAEQSAPSPAPSDVTAGEQNNAN